MKKFTPLLWVGIVAALAVVVLGVPTAGVWVYAYNGEVSRREPITAARGNIHASLNGRYEKVAAFIDAIEDANQTISDFLTIIQEARLAFAQALLENNPVDADAAAETIDSTFTQLVAYMEVNPDSYNTVTLYEGYLAEFSASTNAVIYKIEEFNALITSYNVFIQTFPNVIFLQGKTVFEAYNLSYYNAELPTFN